MTRPTSNPAAVAILTVLAVFTVPAVPAAQTVDPVSTGTTAEFRGLHVVTDSVIWASGRGGVVAHTVDAGKTWRVDTIAGGETLFLVDIHALDARTAWVVGTDFNGGLSRIYRTDDGGGSWTLQAAREGEGVFLDGMGFWDRQRGVAFGDPVGGHHMILRTTDGGSNWIDLPADHIPPALPGEAAFAASGTALALLPGGRGWIATGGGARARVFRTSDYGEHWTAADTPLPGGQTSGLFGLGFRDSSHGLAVGGDYARPTLDTENVVRTVDGGLTWTIAGRTVPPGVKYGVALVPGTAAPVWIAPAPTGVGLSLDDGNTWTVLTTTGYNTAAAAGPAGIWLAGPEGRIARVVLQ
ncbi:MAG: WD40/YVTN/BNR-like repeat-containing protein [Gemmatimonadales bacterium]